MILCSAALLAALASCTKDGEDDPGLIVVGFENVPATFLAPDKGGSSLYDTAGDGQYFGYYDQLSGLEFNINTEDPYGGDGISIYNGGVFISQWNDLTGNTFSNQCSAWYADPATGFGGHNGSKTFAVGYGTNVEGEFFSADTRSSIRFRNTATERVFDHLWVANATYTALNIKDGSTGDFPIPAYSHDNQDWFKLVVEGIDKEGNPTGTVEHYLADYRTASAPGVIAGWNKVDLKPLGAVNKLRFDVQGSDDNGYGTSQPGYFCMDDIALAK